MNTCLEMSIPKTPRVISPLRRTAALPRRARIPLGATDTDASPSFYTWGASAGLMGTPRYRGRYRPGPPLPPLPSPRGGLRSTGPVPPQRPPPRAHRGAALRGGRSPRSHPTPPPRLPPSFPIPERDEREEGAAADSIRPRPRRILARLLRCGRLASPPTVPTLTARPGPARPGSAVPTRSCPSRRAPRRHLSGRSAPARPRTAPRPAPSHLPRPRREGRAAQASGLQL